MIHDVKENAKLFEDIVKFNIQRKGISDLMNYLKKDTDFMYAPASTKYHGVFEGGLVAHSLEVYTQFSKLVGIYNFDMSNHVNAESATIVTLFHDVCKINTYEQSVKYQKNPKTNSWESVPCYTYTVDKNVFGAHGAESMYIISQFMKLTEQEAMAIYHHMGNWDSSKYDNVAAAYEKNRLAWLLHVADEAATYVAGI